MVLSLMAGIYTTFSTKRVTFRRNSKVCKVSVTLFFVPIPFLCREMAFKSVDFSESMDDPTRRSLKHFTLYIKNVPRKQTFLFNPMTYIRLESSFSRERIQNHIDEINKFIDPTRFARKNAQVIDPTQSARNDIQQGEPAPKRKRYGAAKTIIASAGVVFGICFSFWLIKEMKLKESENVEAIGERLSVKADILALRVLGDANVLIKDFEQAKQKYDEAMDIAGKNFGSNDPFIGMVLVGYAKLHLAQGEPERAIEQLDLAIRLLKNIEGHTHWRDSLEAELEEAEKMRKEILKSAPSN